MYLRLQLLNKIMNKKLTNSIQFILEIIHNFKNKAIHK